MEHTNLWRAIDTMAAQHGLSTSGLAIAAGLEKSALNKSKRIRGDVKRWPTTESVAKIIAATKSTIQEFAALIEEQSAASEESNDAEGEPAVEEKKEPEGGTEIIDLASLIYPPYRGMSKFNADGSLVKKQKAYVLRITNDSMTPLYVEHDALMVSTIATVRPNDRVVIYPVDGAAIIGKLVSKTAEAVNIDVFQNDLGHVTLSAEEIGFIHKIEWLRQ